MAAEPLSAPTKVPILKKPWNFGRRVVPNFCSMAEPSTFNATSANPYPTPNTSKLPKAPILETK